MKFENRPENAASNPRNPHLRGESILCIECGFSFTVTPQPVTTVLLCPCCGAVIEPMRLRQPAPIADSAEHEDISSVTSPVETEKRQGEPTQNATTESVPYLKTLAAPPCHETPFSRPAMSSIGRLSRETALRIVVPLQLLLFFTGIFAIGSLVGEWRASSLNAVADRSAATDSSETSLVSETMTARGVPPENAKETVLPGFHASITTVPAPNTKFATESAPEILTAQPIPAVASPFVVDATVSAVPHQEPVSPFAMAKPVAQPAVPLPVNGPQESVFRNGWPPQQEMAAPAAVPVENQSNQAKMTPQPEKSPMPMTPLPDNEEYQARLRLAETMLEEARAILEKNPSRGLVLTVNAIKRFQELGQAVPEGTHWLLGRALSRQCWGATLAEPVPMVETMAVTIDGCWLLTSCADGTLRLWDVARYQQRSGGYILDHAANRFVKLLFSPDSRWAIGGTATGSIYLWDMTQTNPSMHRIEVADRLEGLRGLEISPDGRRLVAYGGTPVSSDRQAMPSDKPSLDPHTVWVWEMEQLIAGVQRPIPLRGHEKGIIAAVISRDSRWLVTGSEDRTVRIFDLHSQTLGLEQTVLKGHEAEVTCVAVAPDNRWVASGDRGNVVRLWSLPRTDPNAGAFILEGHHGWISALAVSDNGQWLASAGYDRTVRLWKMAAFDGKSPPEPGPTLATQQGALQSVRFNPDGDRLVTQGVDSSLRIWNVADSWSSPGGLIDDQAIVESSVLLHDRRVAIPDFLVTGDNRWVVLAYRHHTDPNGSGVLLWPLHFDAACAIARDYVDTVFGETAKVD